LQYVGHLTSISSFIILSITAVIVLVFCLFDFFHSPVYVDWMENRRLQKEKKQEEKDKKKKEQAEKKMKEKEERKREEEKRENEKIAKEATLLREKLQRLERLQKLESLELMSETKPQKSVVPMASPECEGEI